MTGLANMNVRLGWALAALLFMANALAAGKEPLPPQFKYVAGTEKLYEGCPGNLELDAEGLTFKCPAGAVAVPYNSITLMQYRSDLSKKVRKTKVRWKVRLNYTAPIFGGHRNRFFAIVYAVSSATHIMVLEVQPAAMRPYLAEIDLKAGRRIEVEGYEEY
jgi:hypothetical protein